MCLSGRSILLVLALVITPVTASADARGCAWQDTPLLRGQCFLDLGDKAMKEDRFGDAGVAFLRGLSWIDDDYRVKYPAKNSATNLMFEAAMAAAELDWERSERLKRRVLRDALERAKAEEWQ